MTPSLPTLPSASAIKEPISLSLAEIAATLATCSPDSLTSFASVLIDLTAVSTAASMPCLRLIGFAPAATLRRPSRTIAHASTVAVVVPSPGFGPAPPRSGRACRCGLPSVQPSQVGPDPEQAIALAVEFQHGAQAARPRTVPSTPGLAPACRPPGVRRPRRGADARRKR